MTYDCLNESLDEGSIVAKLLGGLVWELWDLDGDVAVSLLHRHLHLPDELLHLESLVWLTVSRKERKVDLVNHVG